MLWIWVEKKSLSRKAFFVPIFILILFFSIRDFTVGTDTITYTKFFRDGLAPQYYEFNPEVEVGYQFVEYLILNITHNYFWLFFFCSLIVVPSYFYIIKKYSTNYILSIFIFITFGLYNFFFNGLRQGIAIAICFLALPFLLDKKILKYFIFVFIASLFHVSAWVMLFFYFLVHSRIKLEYKMISIIGISSIISGLVINYLANSNKRYESYGQIDEASGGYLTLSFYIVLGMFIYIFGKKERINNYNFRVYEQIFLCGLLLVIPVAFLGTDPSGPQRLLNYFLPILTLLLPMLLDKYKLAIFVFLAMIYFYLVTSKFGEIIPYSVNPIFEIF
ncbi:EpsG family protein [Acinetobacter lactucae]|uniref:EpsG family protein n=1 Tax=Acinetobacter lactucae TaxID=1785128 RepID=UPI001D0D65CB|nr:EpsG family protein [Acinetobacter lactucae]